MSRSRSSTRPTSAAVEAALAAAPTRVLYVETISNPTIVVADLAALAGLAHRHGALLFVDNTFASPVLCRPIELGADLVIESLTKYLGGHSDTLGGSVCGSSERIAAVKAVEVDTGATLAPFAAFLILRGIATLAVRMARHAETARALAEWLEAQPGIVRVYHPDLPSHPQHDVAARQFPHASGMLAFELAGSAVGARAAGGAFIDALTIPERTASLGSIHTIVAHPPTTTHRQYDDRAAGRGRDRRRAAALLGRPGGPRRPDRGLRSGARGRPRRRGGRRGRRATSVREPSVPIGAG